jgi:hypothetical protein
MQAYPLLALNGHRFARRQCLLLGVKRTTLYRPRAEILNGTWKFPEAQAVN